MGTLTTGSAASVGNPGNVLIVPTGMTNMKLTLEGLDGSNTVKTQKRTTPGGAWVDQTTYNSNQAAVNVTVATGEEWRIISVTAQAVREVRYKLSCEN